VTDHPIDQALRRASEEIPPVEPELLQKIVHSMQSSLRPVQPLPPTWMLAAGLTLISAAVAGAAAAAIGFYGIEKMLPWQRVLIFSALGMMAWTWGVEFVRQLTPGSRRYLGAGTSFSIGTLMLLGVFALVFRDYHTDHFISAGLACLRSGLLLAIPAALLSWLLLRRGFAVNTIAAGFAGGALAGVCGVAMLALHCANSQALHVLVWHTGVVPVSAAVGALAGWALRGAAIAALR
jgi:Negative regulator of sigma F